MEMERRGMLLGLFALALCSTDAALLARRRKARKAYRRRTTGSSRSRSSAYSGSASFSNCSEAREAGAAPIRSGDAGYSRRLDRDGDGIACE
jgi:hypothetical protein